VIDPAGDKRPFLDDGYNDPAHPIAWRRAWTERCDNAARVTAYFLFVTPGGAASVRFSAGPFAAAIGAVAFGGLGILVGSSITNWLMAQINEESL
jgi:hypothetical protein